VLRDQVATVQPGWIGAPANEIQEHSPLSTPYFQDIQSIQLAQAPIIQEPECHALTCLLEE